MTTLLSPSCPAKGFSRSVEVRYGISSSPNFSLPQSLPWMPMYVSPSPMAPWTVFEDLVQVFCSPGAATRLSEFDPLVNEFPFWRPDLVGPPVPDFRAVA